jgi:D-amino-acid dehydrogenase
LSISRRNLLIGAGVGVGAVAIGGAATVTLLRPHEVYWKDGAATPKFPHIPAKPGDSVVIVGGGLVAIANALHALKRGLKVTIVAPNSQRGPASFGNAGVIAIGDTAPLGTPMTLAGGPSMLLDPEHPLSIRPAYAAQIAPWLSRFALACSEDYVRASTKALSWILSQATDAHFELAADAGASDRLNPLGYLKVFKGEAAFNHFTNDELKYTREVNTPIEFLNDAQLREMEPGLSKEYTHAVMHPKSGSVHLPGEYLRQLEAYAISLGAVRIEEDVKTFKRNGQIVEAAVTATQEIKGDHFIVAAGAWSKPLAAELGADIPLDTERGYHVMTQAREDDLRLRRSIYYSDLVAYSTPMGDQVRVTTGLEFGGLTAAPDYSLINRKAIHAATSHAGIGEKIEGSEWMGFRPSVPDHRPVIGHSPEFANAHFAFGHGHLGLTMSAITGKLLVESMFAQTPRPELAAFSPERFS